MSLRVHLAVALALALALPTARAAPQAQIDQAIQRGVRYLQGAQGADGSWEYPGYPEGSTALAGLALLESGVKASDPGIQRAAQFVRSRAAACSQTYSLSLMIFFLDRLGESRDKPIIVALGERLRNGQLGNGAWTYFCAVSTSAATTTVSGGDNSNTQFATLGLWVARRHNVNVTIALERTDKYFRSTQGRDGGWDYVGFSGSDRFQGLGAVPGIGGSTGAMTCAGLLGLLVQIGNQASLKAGHVSDLKGKLPGKAAAAPADPLKDPAVIGGLKCLEQFLTPQGNAISRLGLGTELYFLWSVERVGVAYGLKKIGAVDWYDAGSSRIIASQQQNGSWSDHSSNVGTSLALLFLNRANVASDLTRLVSNGENTLRAGRIEDLEDLKNAAAKQPAAAPAKPVPKTLTASVIAELPPETLKQALATATAKQQALILKELRDRKGSEATLALAEAIGTLPEPLEAQARTFLVERLERMTPATLAGYLAYENDEIRLAASKAAAGKKDRSLAGPLVELLDQRNTAVADAAHTALVELTGQQFGAFIGESAVNRFVVIKRWKTWWDAQPQPQ